MPAGNHSDRGLAELPSAYAKWRGSALGRITDALEREVILDLIENVAGLSVVDVGCGEWRAGCRTLVARLLGPYNRMFGRLTTVGAAFVALSAPKPSA